MILGIGGHDYELWTNFRISDSYKLNWYDFMYDTLCKVCQFLLAGLIVSLHFRIYSFTCTSHIREGRAGGFRAPSHFTDLSWRYSYHVTIYSNRAV